MNRSDKQKAVQLLHEGRLEEAYEAFRSILHRYPEDWVIYDGLAYLEQNFKNNLEQAKKLIENARVYGCPEARYHRVCADILWTKGQLHEATLEFEKAVIADRSVDNLIAFANSLMKTNYDLATPIWQEVMEKYPSNVKAYLGLMWISGKRHTWSEVLKIANRAKELFPDNPEISFGFGKAYHGLQQYEKALEYYLEAEKQGFAEKFFFHGNVAKCYLELHDYVKSLEHAYEAFKLRPQDDLANELLNRCKERLLWLCGEYRNNEAYPMMAIALEIWPNDSRLLAYMASLEMLLKHNYELGKSYMNNAFEYSNTDLDLLYQIKGSLWFDCLNNKEEGLMCLEKAVSLKRSDINLVALASRIIDSDSERAEKLYEEVLSSEPEELYVIYRLAEISMKLGKWAKGLELAKKGYAVDPSNSNINVLLAFAHCNLGNLREGLKFYLNAVELDFHDKVYIYNSIAECFQKLNNMREARAYARKVLDINPDDPKARQLLEQLGAHE